jgi:hypothetical protein
VIPWTAHFVWLGDALPWVHVLALQSASARGGFERIVLHHDRDLSRTAHFAALAAIPDVELRRLDVDRLLDRCDQHGPALRSVYARLPTPAIRSDLVRLAILYSEGGVYLDIDTVTVRSLRDLCGEAAAFCGEERIVYPLRVVRSRDPAVRMLALMRNGLRDVLGRAPGGWAAFRALERLYPRAVNGAVLGSVARGRFVSLALDRLVQLPAQRQMARCGIGPHLLQELAPDLDAPDLIVHPSPVFYPLGPEISRHWFQVRGRRAPLDEVLLPDTRVVHWYGSVRTRALTERIDPPYVRANAGRQLFSALALPFAGS